MRRVFELACVACLALPQAAASAQTIAGRIVQLGSGAVVKRATVLLVDDSAKVVTQTRGDSTGIFVSTAPGAGRYRVVIYTENGSSFVSPVFTVAEDDYLERGFQVPEIPRTAESVYFPRDVDPQAAPLPGNPAPRYPDSQYRKQERGEVVTFFVVDSTGSVEPNSVQVVRSTHENFSKAVSLALYQMRFAPARREGKPVRQVVQLSFSFGFMGDRSNADVQVRASGIMRERIPLPERKRPPSE